MDENRGPHQIKQHFNYGHHPEVDWAIYFPISTLIIPHPFRYPFGVLWLNAIRRKLNSSTYVP